jgi:glycine cleavage system aminomethyltransferase T
MKYSILFTAPYMIPFVDRFKPVFNKYDIELIVPDVQERMEEADLLKYAGQFDEPICGDDRYSTASWPPLLKKYIALAHLQKPYYKLGTDVRMEITVEHHRKHAPAKVVKLPFYEPEWKRK